HASRSPDASVRDPPAAEGAPQGGGARPQTRVALSRDRSPARGGPHRRARHAPPGPPPGADDLSPDRGRPTTPARRPAPPGRRASPRSVGVHGGHELSRPPRSPRRANGARRAQPA